MRITKYNLDTEKKIGNLKIALFSDIHYSGADFSVKKLNLIVEKIKENHPDYICIPGDFIDSTLCIKTALDRANLLVFFNKLKSICPVILSLGNHDVQQGASKDKHYEYFEDFIEEIRKIDNLYLLDNESVVLNNITFYGLTYSYDDYFTKEAQMEDAINRFFTKELEFPPTQYNVILSHTPLIFNTKSIFKYLKNVDLVLAGHMHNGVIPMGLDYVIKSDRGIVGPSKGLFPRFSRGNILLNEGHTQLIISKGITAIQKWLQITLKY